MADQMQSWSDGQAKTQILEFVRSVTEPGASFVLTWGRIAAFDNDGDAVVREADVPAGYAVQNARRGRNGPCTCDSGRRWTRCHCTEPDSSGRQLTARDPSRRQVRE
jgi:hypothetical protein